MRGCHQREASLLVQLILHHASRIWENCDEDVSNYSSLDYLFNFLASNHSGATLFTSILTPVL